MKTFIALFALALSVNVFAAGSSKIKGVLEMKEVVKLEEKMVKKGYVLAKVVDVHADSGRFPRCICTSFALTFTKTVAEPDAPRQKSFSVSTQGFGASLRVNVRELEPEVEYETDAE